MTDNTLLNFPADISCTVLNCWVKVKDFVQADTAHRHMAGWVLLRQSPLLVLSHNLERMTLKSKFTAESMFGAWLLNRKIRASSFVITKRMQVEDCASYLEKFGVHVSQIKMYQLANEAKRCNCTNTLPLLSTIPNLRTLFLENCSFDHAFLPIKELRLTSLTLSCYSEMAVRLLAACDLACLQSLSLNLTNFMDFETLFAGPYELLQQMLPLCTRLVGLEFAGVDLEGDDLTVLIALCPQVEQHLSLVGEFWVKDDSLMHACALLTHLKTLNIAYTTCTDEVLKHLARCRANTLQGLFFKSSWVSAEGIVGVLQKCQKLRMFGLQFDVDNINEKKALMSAFENYAHNLQYLNLHHYAAKRFEFNNLSVGSLPALKVLEIEHDGYYPNMALTSGEQCKEEEALTPALAQNASLKHWLAARPQLHLQESLRRDYFDIHAVVQDRLIG